MRAALLLALILGGTSQAADKYRSKEGKFAVAFPENAEVRLEGGARADMQKTARAESKDRHYSVMYLRLPEELTEIDAKDLLAHLGKAAVRTEGAKLLSSKELAFGKSKMIGRETVIDTGGSKLRIRFLVTGAWVYTIMVDGPQDFAIEKAGTAFLDSFEIISDDKYASKDGRFAIAFPEGAEVKTDKVPSVGGMVTNIARVEAKDKNYIVAYLEMPATVKGVPAKDLLDSMEKSTVERGPGKLDSSKGIVHGKEKLPGRDIVMDKDGHKMRSRLIISGTRLYMVMLGGPKDFAIEKAGTEFLDSFEITK